MNPRQRKKGFKRLPIEQHREFLSNQKFRHQAHAHVSKRLRKQEDLEHEQEIREYLNGKE